MSNTDPLRVEPGELRAKAGEIDAPWAPTPTHPNAPCGLDMAGVAVKQIYAAADGMQSYIQSGQSEAKRLAQSLEAAAAVYEAVDQAAKAAVKNGQAPSIDPVTPNPNLAPSVPAPSTLPIAGCPAPPGYLDVESAAHQIAAPDQASTLESVAAEWDSYGRGLEARADSFELDSVNWDGTGAESAKEAMLKHRTWLQGMAESSRKLADQARKLADAHRSAHGAHPTVEEVEKVTVPLRSGVNAWQAETYMKMYQALQEKSEHVLAKYAGDSVVDTLDPPKPPSGMAKFPPISGNGDPRRYEEFHKMIDKSIDKSQESGSGAAGGAPPGTGGTGAGTGTGAPTMPKPEIAPVSPASAQKEPSESAPSGGGSPSGGGAPSGGGSPSGGMPGGLPGGMPGGGPDGMPDLAGAGDPELKPAATGGGAGGGVGGGGGGTPLSPAVGGVSVGPSPTGAGTGTAGAGPGGATGGSGGMGGGMGGGGMGHGGGGHNQGKEKRRDPKLSPDENLYEEDRAWTEAVIGNRRRKDIQEAKEPK